MTQLPQVALSVAATSQTPTSPGYAARGVGGEAIAVDASGNAYLLTERRPDAAATSHNLYLTKLNPTATEILFARFLGGSAEDYASSIALDAQGNIYLAGYTASPDLPGAVNSASNPNDFPDNKYDAFVMKLNSAGTQVLYSRYLGGKAAEKATDLAVDSSGNVYVTGTTSSTDFPVSEDAFQSQRKDPATTDSTAAFDAFFTKLNPSGVVAYSTYLGGSREERNPRLAINAAGDIFVAGFTTSPDFPSKGALQPSGNIFLAKLSPAHAGNTGLLFSTFFSSVYPVSYSGLPLPGEVTGLQTDTAGNVYLLGTAVTTTTPGAFQAGFGSGFVAKLDGDGSALRYVTMIGSPSFNHGPPAPYGPDELPNDLAVDGLGNVTVAGYSVRDLPATPDAMQARRTPGDWCGSQRISNWPCADAFVMKLNASGTALLYGSMLGGNSAEDVQAIALDSAGNAYITGVIRGYGYFHGLAPITFPNTVPVFDSESFFTAKFMSGANQTANPSVHVSAASFLRQGLAPESIATAFGTGLATATAAATSQPLPTILGGTTVEVGAQLAPLFFVSPTQINYLVPAGIPFGTSVPVVITNSAGATWVSSIKIDWFTPGLFTANADGRGLAAALAFRVKADGSQSYEPLARFDATTQRFVAVPLDLGAETDRVYLVLFGTGWRAFFDSAPVSASIGGLNATVAFAGAQPGLAGVDQANVLVPRALLGKGEVEVSLTFLQQTSNTVRVVIK